VGTGGSQLANDSWQPAGDTAGFRAQSLRGPTVLPGCPLWLLPQVSMYKKNFDHVSKEAYFGHYKEVSGILITSQKQACFGNFEPEKVLLEE